MTGTIGAAASYFSSSRLATDYLASATVLITPTQSESTVAGVQPAAELIARTYARLVRSAPVLDGAIGSGGLTSTSAEAAGLVDASSLSGTQLLRVSAHGDTPQGAAQLADAIADSLVYQIQTRESSRFTARQEQLRTTLEQLGIFVAEHRQRIAELQAGSAGAEREAQLAVTRIELDEASQRAAVASQNLEDLTAAEAHTRNLAIVVAQATPVPVQPPVVLQSLLGALFGVLIAIVVANSVDKLDDRLLSAERVEALTGLSILGKVPVFDAQTAIASDRDAERWRRASASAEPFRRMWTNLLTIAGDEPVGTLLVTCSQAGEGSSTAAANLAVAAAQAGTRVILVDANLRRPCLHSVFGLPNQTGLTSLLADESLPLENALVQTKVRDLWLLPSGPPPLHPGRWFGSRGVRTRLAELRRFGSLVVIDSPPLLAVSDSASLAAITDRTLLVVDSQTRAPHAARALATLQKVRARLVGAALNRLVLSPPRRNQTAQCYG